MLSKPLWGVPKKDAKFLLGMMLLAFVEVSLIAQLRLWSLFGEVFDLFRMAQAIWSVTQGQWLVYTNHGQNISRLLGHAEVIYFAFAPLLAWAKDASVLLLLQAAFLALGVLPVYRLGQRHGGMGRWLVGVYLFYPAVQTAFLFGFHADTFAAVFLLWALDAMEDHRWPAFWGWVGLTLISKVYMVVPVGFLAVLLWLQGERQRAWKLLLLSVLWFLLAFLGFKWLWAPAYATTPAAHITGYVQFRYDWSHWKDQLLSTLDARLLTLVVLVFPVVWYLPFGKVWTLMWLALTLPALLTSIGTFNYYFHHYVVGAPFLLRAMAECTSSRTCSRWQKWTKTWVNVTIPSFFLGAVLWLAVLLLNQGRVLESARRGWHIVHWLRPQIDFQEPLLASIEILPFFSLRPWLLPTSSTSSLEVANQAQVGVIDLLDTPSWDAWIDRRMLQTLLTSGHWQVVDGYDGVFVIRPAAEVASPLQMEVQTLETLPAFCHERANGALDMENGMLLRCVSLQPESSGRVHVRMVWQRSATGPLWDGAAVTRIGGAVPQGKRWLHLPVWLFHPPSTWRPGEMVLEEMTWTVHLKPGCYPLQVQWWRFRAPSEPGPTWAPWGKSAVLGALQRSPEGSLQWVTHCDPRGAEHDFSHP